MALTNAEKARRYRARKSGADVATPASEAPPEGRSDLSRLVDAVTDLVTVARHLVTALVTAGDGLSRHHGDEKAVTTVTKVTSPAVTGAPRAPVEISSSLSLSSEKDEKGEEIRENSPSHPPSPEAVTVTVTSVTEKPSPSPSPKKRAKAHLTRIADGWQPDETNRAKYAALGLDITHNVEAFIDRARRDGTEYLDWQAGFRTWMKNAIKFGETTPLAPAPPPSALDEGEAAASSEDSQTRMKAIVSTIGAPRYAHPDRKLADRTRPTYRGKETA